MSVNQSTRSGVITGDFFIFFNMKVCCVFSLQSLRRGDSNEYTQYNIFNMKKITLNFPKSAAFDFFQGTQEGVQNSHGNRAISVRATEGLLYIKIMVWTHFALSLHFNFCISNYWTFGTRKYDFKISLV